MDIILLLSYLFLRVGAQEEYGSLLMYEDQKDSKLPDPGKNLNFGLNFVASNFKAAMKSKFTMVCNPYALSAGRLRTKTQVQ